MTALQTAIDDVPANHHGPAAATPAVSVKTWLAVIGATLGSALGHSFGGPVVLLAAVGMMATFGSAVNASLACVVMGVELFGWGAVVPLFVGCAIARWFSKGSCRIS